MIAEGGKVDEKRPQSSKWVRSVYAEHEDGFRTPLLRMNSKFDVRGWLESRAGALRLLGIKKIVVEDS